MLTHETFPGERRGGGGVSSSLPCNKGMKGGEREKEKERDQDPLCVRGES